MTILGRLVGDNSWMFMFPNGHIKVPDALGVLKRKAFMQRT